MVMTDKKIEIKPIDKEHKRIENDQIEPIGIRRKRGILLRTSRSYLVRAAVGECGCVYIAGTRVDYVVVSTAPRTDSPSSSPDAHSRYAPGGFSCAEFAPEETHASKHPHTYTVIRTR